VKQLDRTKPYATTHGEASHAYEQDGVYFDAAGNEVRGGKRSEQVAAAPKSSSEVDRQVDSQLGGGEAGNTGSTGNADAAAAARAKFEGMTKAQLQKHLKHAKVEFEGDANKERLVDLAVEAEAK
jgi:hypothetical protein